MKKYSFIMLMSFLFLTSCESFLTEVPLSTVSGDKFFKTTSDANVSISAIYSNIRGHYNGNVWYFGDISTEIASNGETTSTLNSGEYTSADLSFRDMWTVMYRTINYANDAIKNIPGITMNISLRDRYVAEARFLRALSYFELVRAFGGVPKITEPTTDPSNNSIPRATADEIYNLIFEDLKICETVLPANYAAADIGRATSGAAKALMAKAYLQKGDFANTLIKTKEVIQSGNYQLLPNLKDVFDVTKKNGKEHIFSIQFKAGFATETLGSNITYTFASRNPEINPNGNGKASGSGVAAELQWYNSIPDHYRKRYTILKSFPSLYYPVIKANGPALAGPTCMKYWDPKYTTNVGGDDANWMVLRYADILLMFAEAENEINGPTQAAYDAVNQIRKRARDENNNNIDEPSEIAELPNLAGLSKDDFRKAVWNERDMELCFEGHHRWDLVRTNRFAQVMQASGRTTITEKNNLFPIPALEIAANPNLTQNPGY